MLLSGTLYAYDDENPGAEVLPSARSTQGLTQTLGIPGAGLPSPLGASRLRQAQSQQEQVWTAGLADSIQRSLDRILESSLSGDGGISPTSNTSGWAEEEDVLQAELRRADTSRSTHVIEDSRDSPDLARSARSQPLSGYGTDLDVDEDGVHSVSNLSESTLSPAHPPIEVQHSLLEGGGRNQIEDPFERSDSSLEFGETVHSGLSSPVNQSLQNTARTVMDDTMTPSGGLDGGLANVLHRLSLDPLDLDESLTRSLRRVLQIGFVLSGRGLLEEEIQALPQVRFEATELQSCAICLEVYHRGELLTALRCQHFFHIDCLARWFHQSTQCPLCRAECAD